MTMSTTGTESVGSGRVRWSWLWNTRQDVAFNLLPFWLGYVLLAALFLTRQGGAGTDPHWMASLGSRSFDITGDKDTVYIGRTVYFTEAGCKARIASNADRAKWVVPLPAPKPPDPDDDGNVEQWLDLSNDTCGDN